VRPDSPPPSPWDSASPDSDSHGGARAMRGTTPPVWRGFRFWHGRLFLLPCPRMSNGSATRALRVPVPRPTHRQAGPRTPRCRSGRDRGALFGMGDPGRAGDPRRRSRRAVNGPSDHRDIESANGIKAARLCTTHPQDRTFFVLNAVVAWVALVMGFAPGLLGHFSGATPFHPPIVHVHAVVFTGWLALFTAQIWMIRSRRVDIHRRTRSRCCCS